MFLGEYYISMPAVLSPGSTVLRVKNEGFEEHDLQFTRAGADSVTWRIEKRLSPGEVRTVTLDLDAGACAVVEGGSARVVVDAPSIKPMKLSALSF